MSYRSPVRVGSVACSITGGIGTPSPPPTARRVRPCARRGQVCCSPGLVILTCGAHESKGQARTSGWGAGPTGRGREGERTRL
jgi:hypothetical protein